MDCFLLLILYLVWKKLRVSPVLLLAFAFAALYWTQLALSAFGAFYRQILSVVLSVCSESRVFSDSSDSLSKKEDRALLSVSDPSRFSILLFSYRPTLVVSSLRPLWPPQLDNNTSAKVMTAISLFFTAIPPFTYPHYILKQHLSANVRIYLLF